MMRSSLIVIHFLILVSACTKTAFSAEIKVEPSSRVIALTSFSADITQKISAESLVAIPESKLLAENPNMKYLPIVQNKNI